MNISEVASLLGIIFGITGAVLGTLSYFRDRPKIIVTLKWDMAVTDNPTYDPNRLWGVVTVTNIGRRTIFISAAALDFGKSYDHISVLLDSVRGIKLAEGDLPATFMIDQNGLEEYKKNWKNIRAKVQNSAGKTYYSKKVNKHKIPSWVNKK